MAQLFNSYITCTQLISKTYTKLKIKNTEKKIIYYDVYIEIIWKYVTLLCKKNYKIVYWSLYFNIISIQINMLKKTLYKLLKQKINIKVLYIWVLKSFRLTIN